MIHEPRPDGPAGAERWVGYLDWCREELIRGVLRLDPEQRRLSTVASGWTPIELLSHVLHMEQRWFVWGFLGEQVAEPWGDWTVPEPWTADDSDETREGARWTVPERVGAEELAERLRTLGARTSAVLRTHALDARAASGGRFGEDPPTLEWICFHVLAEYARHAGHLDIAVETISGR
ncbi:DUF664 domain-containing protein [Nocardioides sp. BGMRC 2183]|nr:DUF664 domain-containing protein [Nocardioides sp. BGMRC 2183]